MYRHIIRQALALVWGNKKIWFLGIFTSFIAATSEAGLLQKITTGGGEKAFSEFFLQLKKTQIFTGKGLGSAWTHLTSEPVIFIKIISVSLLILSFLAVIIWFSLISQGAIISASRHKHADRDIKIGPYIKTGIKKFWPILGINLITQIFLNLLYLTATKFFNISIVLSISIAILAIMIFLIITTMTKYAICDVVSRDERMFSGLKKSVKFFINFWKEGLSLSVLLFLINIITTVITVFAAGTLLFVPFLFIIEASVILKFTPVAIFFLLLFISLSALLFVAVLGFLSAFSWVAWSIMYQFTHKTN